MAITEKRGSEAERKHEREDLTYYTAQITSEHKYTKKKSQHKESEEKCAEDSGIVTAECQKRKILHLAVAVSKRTGNDTRQDSPLRFKYRTQPVKKKASNERKPDVNETQSIRGRRAVRAVCDKKKRKRSGVFSLSVSLCLQNATADV